MKSKMFFRSMRDGSGLASRHGATVSVLHLKIGARVVLLVALAAVCLAAVTHTASWFRVGGSTHQVLTSEVDKAPQPFSSAGNLGTLTSFDVSGAGTGASQGTVAIGMDAAGDIAGTYLDSKQVAHGFVRAANGTISKFDAPGAGTGSPGADGSAKNQGTIPIGINSAGVITGFYVDKNIAYHGFVRAANGTITEFDVAGAINTQYPYALGTRPIGINTAGVITGTYLTDNFVWHGFTRAANGTIATFDVSGAPGGTIPIAIDTAGDVVGAYLDSNYVYHGFSRSANGSFSKFDAPGSYGSDAGGMGWNGTIATCINDAGMIGGTFEDKSGVLHGFLRAIDGSFTIFEARGAGSTATGLGMLEGTGGLSIDLAGDIAGVYLDSNLAYHGFYRAVNGTITSIDAANAGTTAVHGTGALGLNATGFIAGTYVDANSVAHGFVITPPSPPAAAPSFSVAAGTYSSAQTVTLTDSTPGSTIYYTTDGKTTPTSSSAKYTAPIKVASTETIQAIATAKGYATSPVASAAYTLQVAPPAFNPAVGTYPTPQSVTITDSTTGATIYYTIDGSTPTSKSTKYASPVKVAQTTTISAIATATGFTTSIVSTGVYSIVPVAATPTFSPAAGSFTSAQSVKIGDTTAGATIYFTTDGSAPSTASTKYTAAIAAGTTETINAIAVATGYAQSATATAKYTITLPTATPAFSLPAGTYAGTQQISITDATPSATIYYTTNGSTPTTNSTKYTAPVAVAATETLKATATAPGYSQSAIASAAYTIAPVTATPTITTTAGQNGAVVVKLTSATPNATITYTLDGSTPVASSQLYLAPFLLSANATLNVLATASGHAPSAVASQAFTPNVASGTLIWSDEFANSTSANAQPNPGVWTYDTGGGGWGNNELETYCAWGFASGACSVSNPNAYVGTDGSLHIVARNPSTNVYTSARMKSQGLFSFQYGRFEVRAKIPEGQGLWPAIWLLGDDITTVSWPACGELDVMEHINGSNPQNEGFDWVQGSIHGTNLNGGIQYHPSGFDPKAWHTYGMIWTKGQIQYYIDDPSKVYATFNKSSQTGTWPFDSGPEFVILNLAVGGSWPGSPDKTTTFPSELVVDYVRIYAN